MRRTARLFAAAGIVVVLAGAPLSEAAAQTSGDWPTYLNNGARTGYNSAETVVTPATARRLTQLWTDTAGGAVSAEPIQVNGVIYYGSWDGHERAVNAATGSQRWSAFLGQTTHTSCNPPTVGVASTATIGTITVNGTATQAVLVAGGNGNFYALNASTGAVIWKPRSTQSFTVSYGVRRCSTTAASMRGSPPAATAAPAAGSPSSTRRPARSGTPFTPRPAAA